MNPIAIANKGKGYLGVLRRASSIGTRYGLTPAKMDRILSRFAQLLAGFRCGATFPITAAAFARNRGVIEKYQAQGVEFAVHGYYHVDHRQLTLDEQFDHFTQARRLFEQNGLTCVGFRCPYLRWNEDTLTALRRSGFLYDSSRTLAWDVARTVETTSYHRVLDFYGAQPAAIYPSLPTIEAGLVEIPYCLPDDEALIERFHLRNTELLNRPWQTMLAETHRLGELFTLGLHPERIFHCETPLIETLLTAQALSPGVWIARLDEIAHWWAARNNVDFEISSMNGDGFHLQVRGPEGTTILARGMELNSPSVAWDGVYQQVIGLEACWRSPRRPFIGLSPSSSPSLKSFLHQQGYIIEPAEDDRTHTFYLDRPQFEREDQRPLLAMIEQGDFPLIRLGRWPNGARSALCITGDIDALTLWDYSLRFLGK